MYTALMYVTSGNNGEYWAPPLSGPSYCQFDENGCVTDGPGDYGNNEACTVRVMVTGTLSATEFSTEGGSDYVTIDGTNYSGTAGPSKVFVHAGDSFTWSSDQNTNHRKAYSGWTICLEPGLLHFCAPLPVPARRV